MFPGPVAVGVGILHANHDANHDGVPDTHWRAGLAVPQLPHYQRALAHVHLDAMMKDPQPHGECEGLAEPGGGLIHVAIG